MPPVVWLTGLSGSGKTTICNAVMRELKRRAVRAAFLDGDEIRKHLCPDLGYTRADRIQNVLRISYVAGLLTQQEVTVLAAAITPYEEARQRIREAHPRFIEVFVNAPIEICETRDPKGLYKKTRAGLIEHFTGISDPYEAPQSPDVECRTDHETVEESCAKVMAAILELNAKK
jgi:adenylylsulfate kinase